MTGDPYQGPAPEDCGDAVLVVGAGLAGLFLALKLAPRPVVVLTPVPLGTGSASAWAQGGLAAALAPDDNPALHAADTIAVGAGLVDPAVAQLLAEAGPARVVDLLALGVPFDRSPDGHLRQSLEAAHSRPRVARVSGDLAGKAIMEALIAATRLASHIRVVEGLSARALLQDAGGRVRGLVCRTTTGSLTALTAAEVVLATGGVGGLYAVTTNPASAQGHGLAMAARAGALLADLEFVQFHPTAIDVGRDPAPLATEALRGEGAVLRDRHGALLMTRYHPLADLAPRDIVARAVHSERMAGNGAFLDATSAVGAEFPTHFPTVFAACMAAGIDPRTDLIPVAPAAHYHMGGIVTDLWAKTTVAGLSAIGECASVGVHGANRLASNSLLEAIVFADRLAQRLADEPTPKTAPARSGPLPRDLTPADLAGLRALMAADVGVVRDAAGLSRAAAALAPLADTNPGLAAGLLVEAATRRRESRGAHFRADFPEPGLTAERGFLAPAALGLGPQAVPRRDVAAPAAATPA